MDDTTMREYFNSIDDRLEQIYQLLQHLSPRAENKGEEGGVFIVGASEEEIAALKATYEVGANLG